MNAADLLARRLRELGVRRLYGEALPGLDPDKSTPAHVAVGDPDLAVLLADADGRIGEIDGGARLGAALLAGPLLHLSSQPGGTAELQTVGSPEELLDALVDPPGLTVPATTALHLDLDLSAPVPDDIVATIAPQRQPVMTLAADMASLTMLIVVGPGVVRARGLDGLQSLSRATGAGIVNTWGAEGVQRWDSPWRFGTVGLQQRDLELAGIGAADVVIASGLDPVELPGGIPHGVVQEVPPAQLGALCQRWATVADPPASRPAVFTALAEVMGPLYERDTVPLSPARAALHLSGALPDAAMAVVDPGLAGFWVARSFPTSIPNSVCVPGGDVAGFAVAAAIVCRLEGRAVLAVTDSRGIEAAETEALVAWADSAEVSVALQVWEEDAVSGWGSSADHVDLLEQHLDATTSRVDPVPIDFSATSELVEVAGEVCAWGLAPK